MKKTVIILTMLGLIIFSGFTNINNTRFDKVVYQEGTTETITETTETTETIETTEAVETTVTPASTATPVPTTTTAAAYARPLLNLTSYSYDTYDVYAGSVFTLSSVFKNPGQQRAYNIVIAYSASSFTAEDNGGVDVISSLGAGESVSSSQDFVVSSSLSSSPIAVDIKVEYKNESGESFSQSFTVSVIASGYGTYYTSTPEGRPQMVVADYETDVDTLEPGTTFLLTMNLQNRGYLGAANTIMLIGGSSSDSSNSTTVSENFLPMGSSNVVVIGDVAVQQYVQIQQTFVVNSDTDPGVYPLTLNFTYEDEDGNEFSDTQIITLLVYLVPTIEISFYEEPDTMYVGEDATLPIQVVNMGSDSMLLGDIHINVENAILSNNQTYIGNLESGGSFTIDTDITPQQAGSIPVTITINYQDNFKKTQTITQTLSITVEESQSMAPAQGQDSSLVATQMAQFQTQQQTSSNFMDIVLRFFRGMLGFDSSATTNRNRMNPGSINLN